MDINHAPISEDLELGKKKKTAWGAKKGERIRGRLFRGGGGKFMGGPSDEELGDIGMSREVSNALLNLLKGERVNSVMVAELIKLGLMDESGKLNKMGKATAEALKAKDAEEAKRLLDAAKPAAAGGGGGGGGAGGAADELLADAQKLIDKSPKVAQMLLDFISGEKEDDNTVSVLIQNGLIGKDGKLTDLGQAIVDLQSKTEERQMPMTDVGQIAASAIETALAVVRSTGEITEARAVKLLHALEADLSEAWQPGGEVRVMDRASIDIDGKRVTLNELITTYREAVAKTVGGEPRPAGDFLGEAPYGLHDMAARIEDSFTAAFAPDTRWTADKEPRYRTRDVFKGHPTLGNSIVVNDRRDGLSYAVGYTDGEEAIVFAVRQDWKPVQLTYITTGSKGPGSTKAANEEAEAAEPGGPEFCACPECDYETEKVRGEPCRAMECPECGAALVAGVETKAEPKAEEVAELCESATFGEVGRGYAVNFIEAKANSPAYIDLVPVKAGWGNKRDNHYYDLPMLRECAHVWKGAKMWPSDHRQDEKNALNQVTEVVESPIGFTEKGEPIVRAVILSAEFEDVARRRQEAGILHTLQNSILGTGTVRKKPFERGGRKGKYVESINADTANIDWVTSAGAGGHAVGLAESSNGGGIMEKKIDVAKSTETKQVEGTETEQVEEVTLAEGDTEVLAEDAVTKVLEATNLPAAFKEALAVGKYETDEQLTTAIETAIGEVKKLTGSGQVFGQGQTSPVTGEPLTEAEREAKSKEAFNRIMSEVGLEEV